MERLVYCDTHIIVGIYANNLSLFPRETIRLLEQGQVLMSPVVLLEMEYLYEVGKVKASAETMFKELEKSIGLKICDKNFVNVAYESLKLSWTRDPFDRFIVAQASLTKSSLITKDELIREHYRHAVWD